MRGYWAARAYEDEWHALLSPDVSADHEAIARLAEMAGASGGGLVRARDRHGNTRPCHIKVPLGAADAVRAVLDELRIEGVSAEEVGAPFTGFEWATVGANEQ